MEAAVGGVFLMLCGLALEVLYKAVCVSKAKPVDQRHHRLVDHARGAGVAISKKEEKLLEILTEYIYWSGKYPVPKEPQSAARLRRLSRDHLFDSELIGSLKIHRPNGALNWASFEELWKNAAQEYVETNSA